MESMISSLKRCTPILPLLKVKIQHLTIWSSIKIKLMMQLIMLQSVLTSKGTLNLQFCLLVLILIIVVILYIYLMLFCLFYFIHNLQSIFYVYTKTKEKSHSFSIKIEIFFSLHFSFRHLFSIFNFFLHIQKNIKINLSISMENTKYFETCLFIPHQYLYSRYKTYCSSRIHGFQLHIKSTDFQYAFL